MPKRVFSPDFHVVFTTFCRLIAQNMAYKGGSQAAQDPPGYAPELPFVGEMVLHYLTKLLTKLSGLIYF